MERGVKGGCKRYLPDRSHHIIALIPISSPIIYMKLLAVCRALVNGLAVRHDPPYRPTIPASAVSKPTSPLGPEISVSFGFGSLKTASNP